MLGEFWIDDWSDRVAGRLEIDNGSIELRLFEHLKEDRLIGGGHVGGRLPRGKDNHQHVFGLLEDCRQVTLLNLTGYSGVRSHSWVQGVTDAKEAADDAGNPGSMRARVPATMFASHLIEAQGDNGEPEFDVVRFRIPGLHESLGRSAVMSIRSTRDADGVSVFATHICDVEPLVVDLDEYRLTISQSIAYDGRSETSEFTIRKRQGSLRFLEICPLLHDLRLLAELLCGSHATVASICGEATVDIVGPQKSTFEIRSNLERKFDEHQSRPRVKVIDLAAVEPRPDEVGLLTEWIADAKPELERIIFQWVAWLSRGSNRDLVSALVAVYHEPDPSEPRKVFEAAIKTLESMADPAHEPPRVQGLPATERQERARVQAAIKDALDQPNSDLDQHASKWAKDLIAKAIAGKGAGRRLDELLRDHKAAFPEYRTGDRSAYSRKLEEVDTLGTALWRFRSKHAHSTSTAKRSSGKEMKRRAVQAEQIAVGIILSELGADAGRIQTSLSRWNALCEG
jgi:hypothetical protein